MIAEATASLGFAAGIEAVPDAHLVVVDNGSTDGTLHVLDRIRKESAGPVHLFSESVQGYVPPRRRGVTEVNALSRSMGVNARSVLVLQADADTKYKPGYIAAMRAAVGDRAGIILEGATRRLPAFEAAHPAYVAAERLVDDEIERLDADDEDEVVVDDKVCGYRLADYMQWGGLFEEHTAAGDPIHAETTRMFIRARLTHGARKIRVNPAGAASSRRKVAEDPWLHYATVGFPREASWTTKVSGFHSLQDIDAFGVQVLQGQQPEAVYLRRAHQLALFRYLPALVACVSGDQTAAELPADVSAVFDLVKLRSRSQFARAPGLVLVELLQLIDGYPEHFDGSSAQLA